MSIVKSVITSIRTQVDGRAYVRERHIDHVGQVREVEYLSSEPSTAEQVMLARVPFLEEQTKDAELQQYISMVLAGVPIMPAHPPVYNDVKEVYAFLFNHFMQEADPVVLLKAAGFTDLFSDDEMVGYGLTKEMISAIRIEADKIKQAAALLDSYQPLVGTDAAKVVEIE